MPNLRYDYSKRQAKSCKTLNPEHKNMATLYQIQIQNQRAEKQLDQVYKFVCKYN